MATLNEVICIAMRAQSAAEYFLQVLREGGKYQIHEKHPILSSIIDGDAEEIANYLKDLLREQEDREAADRRKLLIEKIRVFLDRRAASGADADALVKYIIQQTGVEDVSKWFADQNRIAVYYEWESCSFFDDGGGEKGFRKCSVAFVEENGDYVFENHRLNSHSRLGFNEKATFYCLDPFGLKGIYQISYERERRRVD